MKPFSFEKVSNRAIDIGDNPNLLTRIPKQNKDFKDDYNISVL